jgi:hypothetical protein
MEAFVDVRTYRYHAGPDRKVWENGIEMRSGGRGDMRISQGSIH